MLVLMCFLCANLYPSLDGHGPTWQRSTFLLWDQETEWLKTPTVAGWIAEQFNVHDFMLFSHLASGEPLGRLLTELIR